MRLEEKLGNGIGIPKRPQVDRQRIHRHFIFAAGTGCDSLL